MLLLIHMTDWSQSKLGIAVSYTIVEDSALGMGAIGYLLIILGAF